MTPTIYGYARLLPGADSTAELSRVRRKLNGFAGRRGFRLMDVMMLERPGDRLEVWAELLWSCRLFRVSDIVVPSLAHLHDDESLATFMCEDVARWISGRVWIVGTKGPVVAAPVEELGVMAR
ncbi:hypothetical protein [Streptomyces sp. NPDC013455]|uniref:hypothetical protein n=1 Tax=Streptomyces sp. NPDC013455 TaxID=3155605 RepID=UPI0034029D4A